jgi:hypothetical protein
MNKALHGTVQASPLLSNNQSNFLINDTGRTIDKQSSIIVHVHELKMPHIDPRVIDFELHTGMCKRYGQETPTAVTCGKINYYLGMRGYVQIPGKVVFLMDDFNENRLEEVPDDFFPAVRQLQLPATSFW